MSNNSQLYFNGTVQTMDRACPKAEAVAVRDGKIVGVGSRTACQAALEKGFEAIDMRKGALLPGFIDTHLHPVLIIYFSLNCDTGAVGSMEELQREMRRALLSKSDDSWLVGFNFDEQNLSERRVPLRRDLDKITADRPVVVMKHDGHSVFANTRAIEAAGVTSSTEDPPAGRIEREADGRPSGTFREAAMQLILKAMPMPDLQVLVEGARQTFRRLASFGLTSLGVILQTDEEGPAGSAGAFDTTAMQLFTEECPLSLYSLLIAKDMENLEALKNTTLAQGPNRLGGVKLFADGTFGSSTGYMLEPFSDSGGTGQLMHSPENLYRLMTAVHEAGWQICIHAIGDAANRLCAELYGRLFQEFPRRGCRHRVEHASIMDDWTMQELSLLGIVVSTQPLFIHSEKNWLARRLGAERCKKVYPFRSFLDAGVKLAGASDGPIESQDVLHAVSCCVSREGFETHECITVEEALRMYTINAAFAQFEENIKGSITPGKRADLVLLSRDPFIMAPEEIRDIEVMRTVAAGRRVDV